MRQDDPVVLADGGMHGKITLISTIGVLFTVYQLWAVTLGRLTPVIHRSIHLSFALFLGFVVFRGMSTNKHGKVPFYDYLLAAVGCLSSLYMAVNYIALADRIAHPTALDQTAFVLLVLTMLEVGRRTMGWALPGVVMVAIAYAFLGNYLPEPFRNRGFDLERITGIGFISMDGVFGIALGVSADWVFLFILFGAILNVTGAGKFLTDLSFSIAGKAIGGPAKVAVVASGLMGTISGSSVANVVTTGQFTIPLMKQVGFKPYFAGAVEAVASTGGLLMPPIMGAGAFVMAEFLGVPYATVMKTAIVPALLYYFALYVTIHYEAMRLGLTGLKKESLPVFAEVFREGWFFALVILMLIGLLGFGYPVQLSALATILLLVVSISLRKKSRVGLRTFLAAVTEASIGVVNVAVACALAGVVIGMVSLSGIALKLGSIMVDLTGGNMYIGLFFTALFTIILGMGLPATASYIIGVSVTMFMMKGFGIPPLVAHMFVFYYAVISNITPPVALAAYAAAGIAGASAMKTAVYSSLIGLTAFVIPFMFVADSSLVLVGPFSDSLVVIGTAIIGVFALGISIAGYFQTALNVLERVLLIAAGIMMIAPRLDASLVGIVTIFVVLIRRRLVSALRRNQAGAAS